MSSKYKLIQRKMDALNVLGFNAENEDGNTTYIAYDDCLKLARLGRIENASLILDILNGDYILKVDGGVAGLPIVQREVKYKVLGRIIKDNKCVGYNISDKNSGKTYKISINKIWELAKENEIEGIEGIILNNHKVIRGTEEGIIEALNRFET